MGCANQEHRASHRWLQKNRRLHLQHGPIDLIINADGDPQECAQAFQQAVAFFDSVLVTLVNELPLLRTPVSTLSGVSFKSVVAQHMHKAVAPYADQFVTPMVCVAGSVADCTLAKLCRGRTLSRASVNNGGDIALHLSSKAHYKIGICENPSINVQHASARINAASPVRGVATSGWHGRSHSLGIADAVTVLALNASQADVAATLIANKIDLPGSRKIKRVAASSLSPDTDLGERAVTVGVQALTSTERYHALFRGERFAHALVSKGLINSAILNLQGQQLVVGQHPLINWRHCA